MVVIFDSKVAKNYDFWYRSKLGSLVDEVEKEMVLKMARPKEGEKALDLGCGTGVYSILLAEKGLDVTGLDISPYMLREAGKKIEDKDLSIEFMEGNLLRLPFADETFDLVLAVTVFEFLREPERAAREAWRVVKKGGRFILGVLARESPWSEFYEKEGQKGNSVWQKARFFTPKQLLNLLPGVRGEYTMGLYFGPNFSVEDKEKALEVEAEGQKSQRKNGGFICGRWEK